jgi:hypothetical protein
MGSGTLEAALTDLLVLTGARAARVLDLRTGTVVAEVGVSAQDDVYTLMALARAAGPVATTGGGLDDIVVTTRRSVHVLRETAVPGLFLHARLDHGAGNIAAARQQLASPVLQGAAGAMFQLSLVPELPALPQPRSAGGAHRDQPALASLVPRSRQGRSGELAVLALGPDIHLPRRVPAQAAAERARAAAAVAEQVSPRPSTPAVLAQAWSTDAGTLRRLLVALRRRD